MTTPDGEIFQRLCFRDLLHADAGERDAYAALKHELALRHREDGEAYTDAKADYVNAAVQRARDYFKQ